MSTGLKNIKHIVVLMLENRSFDHMLGYLTVKIGRTDIDGLTGSESNDHLGQTHRVRHLDPRHRTFSPDPCHTWACVHDQIAGNNGGFISDFAAVPANEPQRIMGYHDDTDLPVYDFLASEFCVCDRWFSSVPGATWPNRLYSLAGNSDGDKDNPSPFRLYSMPTVFEHLDRARVPWRYYSHDVAFLRAFKKYTGTLGPIDKIGRFFRRAKRGNLHAVSWIDPDYTDFGVGGNDDHPPSHIYGGQDLVCRVYNALLNGGRNLWNKTLLIVTYDEHGGFYDHVCPSRAEDDRPDFRQYGLRVPAFLISPWVEKASVCKTVLDHTSLIKTVLARFCRKKTLLDWLRLGTGAIPDMGARVRAAADVGPCLTRTTPRKDCRPTPQVDRAAAEREMKAVGVESRETRRPNELQGLLERLAAEAKSRGVPEDQL